MQAVVFGKTCYDFVGIRRRASRAAVILPERTDHRKIRRIGYLHVLLRKEVIQPLVLERLPCYDFTPITKPTFGRALQLRLDYGLRVFPALMV